MKRLILSTVSILFIAIGCESLFQDNDDGLDSPELQALSDGLVSDLGLSKSGTNDLNDVLRRHGSRGRDQDPGFLWKVAAELQQTLSDDEKSNLFDRMEDHDINYFGGILKHKKGKKYRGTARIGLEALRSILTEDQLATFDDILNSWKEKKQEIHQDESLSREDARNEMESLREAMKAEIEALLSDEQKAQLEQMRADYTAEREKHQQEIEARLNEAKQVMVDVLDLTVEQIAAFDTFQEDAKNAITALKDQFKNGNIDREAFRDAAKSIFDSLNENLEALFTDTQMEIIKIHKALQLRMKNHRRNQDVPGDRQRGRRSDRRGNG